MGWLDYYRILEEYGSFAKAPKEVLENAAQANPNTPQAAMRIALNTYYEKRGVVPIRVCGENSEMKVCILIDFYGVKIRTEFTSPERAQHERFIELPVKDNRYLIDDLLSAFEGNFRKFWVQQGTQDIEEIDKSQLGNVLKKELQFVLRVLEENHWFSTV